MEGRECEAGIRGSLTLAAPETIIQILQSEENFVLGVDLKSFSGVGTRGLGIGERGGGRETGMRGERGSCGRDVREKNK